MDKLKDEAYCILGRILAWCWSLGGEEVLTSIGLDINKLTDLALRI